jgi:hypothetical protein
MILIYVYHKALNDGPSNSVIRITIFGTFDIKSIRTLKYNECLSKSPNSRGVVVVGDLFS